MISTLSSSCFSSWAIRAGGDLLHGRKLRQPREKCLTDITSPFLTNREPEVFGDPSQRPLHDEVVEREKEAKGFEVLPRWCILQRAFGWLRRVNLTREAGSRRSSARYSHRYPAYASLTTSPPDSIDR